MIQIFGLLFFIILICLIYLYYQGKISRNIPLIFMFFLILIIPFTYLETNKINVESYSNYDQIMNSSLDIFYTNRNSKERTIDQLKKIKLIDNPIQTVLVKKDIKPITITIYTKYYTPYISINITSEDKNENVYTNFSNVIAYTYITEDDLFNKDYDKIKSNIKQTYSLKELTDELGKIPSNASNSYIIIIGNNGHYLHTPDVTADVKRLLVDKFKFGSWVNDSWWYTGAFIVLLSKSNDVYTKIADKATRQNEFISITQNIIADSLQVESNGGPEFTKIATNDKFIKITDDPLIKSKINIISPSIANTDYAISFTSENNESFVYLSSRKLANKDEVTLYAKSPKNDIGPTSTTYLDTQRPQFWSFEPVSQIVTTPLIVFIRTYSRPYFYLDAELENGVMVLKASRFKAGLRQQWEFIQQGTTGFIYKIRHLKSGMYLAYSDFDGYLYKDDGSVFLTKSDKYTWNIKQILENQVNKNIIENFEGFEPTRQNTFQGMEVPADYGSVADPSWKISGNVKGKNIVIESKGRTVWEDSYSPIWSGKWIYYGTVASYKATLDINKVKFLIIKIDANGNGIVEDEFLNFKMNVINAGANILTGIIPSGDYSGYRATLKLIPTDLKYSDPLKPFPVKMRYFIEKNNTTLNLSSGNIYNMEGYSTKFVGDKLILSNFLEASGIQTDANLAFSKKTLNEINDSIKEQQIPKFEIFEDTNCVYGRLYNGYKQDGSRNDYKYLGKFNSYEECAKSPNIPANAKAIAYHNDNIVGWAQQCFSINDNNTKKSNENYAVCGVRIVPKIMYGPWITKQQEVEVRKLGNRKIVYIIYDDEYTKMVSSDGQEKYYKGTINQFNKDDWDKYSKTDGGKYLLKDINVVVYEHGNYQGRSLELGVGYYDNNYLVGKGFNDNISSIIVPPELLVEGWEDNHGAGRKWVFNSNTNWVGNDANDRISTLVVKKKVISNTWNVIWKADIGYINFSIDDNKKIAFHFNIRETTTVINTYDEGWQEAKYIQNFHSLRRPINFEISFNVSTGFTVVYQGNKENERIVANFPNRLNVPNANIFTITSSDNITISFKNPEKRPVPPCPQGWYQSGNQCLQICKLNCQSRHSDGTCICNSGGCNQNCNYGTFSCLNNKCTRDASF